MREREGPEAVKTGVIALDLPGLLEFQRNRPPYLLFDMADEIVPGVSAKGHKQLKPDEWFFECHFPGDPNMPGMLQMEAMVQLTALALFTMPGNKGKVGYIVAATNLKFLRKVLPGDRLDLEGTIHSFKRGIAQCSGKGFVNGQPACQAEFTLALPHILEQFKRPDSP